MEIESVSPAQFEQICSKPYQIFNSALFNSINENKVDKVYYLVSRDTKYRLGIIIGIKGNKAISPFSAPFGGFTYIKNDIKLEQIENTVDELILWLKKMNIKSLKITSPPNIYSESFIAKQANVLYRKGFQLDSIELNFTFNTRKLIEDYQKHMWRNARKNLKISVDSDLSFNRVMGEEGLKSAHEVIQKNRSLRGFPLRMTFDDLLSTAEIIQIDCFLCYYKQAEIIASAIVYHVSDLIVQVVYWGDLPEFSYLKTMNFLSYNVFQYYQDTNIEIVDIGPSTEDSEPNYGLCEFKESMGCDLNQKHVFIKEIE